MLNDSILKLKSLVPEGLERLENRGNPDKGSLPTPLSRIFGSKQAEITHRCTYSFLHRALWDGQLVARLMYGDNVTWEQLVRVYENMYI